MDLKKTIIRSVTALSLSYITTAACISLAALILWKFEFSESMFKWIIIGTYILGSLTGGWYIGKKQKEKKFLWGFLIGILYFLTILILAFTKETYPVLLGRNMITTGLLCSFSATLGGMIA